MVRGERTPTTRSAGHDREQARADTYDRVPRYLAPWRQADHACCHSAEITLEIVRTCAAIPPAADCADCKWSGVLPSRSVAHYAVGAVGH
jgi:hypothetical protein